MSQLNAGHSVRRQLTFDFGDAEDRRINSAETHRMQLLATSIEQLDDPARVSRIITLEIVECLRAMTAGQERIINKERSRAKSKIKNLRELHRSILECEFASDYEALDLEGRKFLWFLGELVRLFSTALSSSGLDADAASHILERFTGLWNEAREGLRQ